MIYNICSVIKGMFCALNTRKITCTASPLLPPHSFLIYSLNILQDCETAYLLWIYSVKPQLFLLLLKSNEDLAVIQQIRSLITWMRWSCTLHCTVIATTRRRLFSPVCGFTLANSGFACCVTNQESDTSGAITEAQRRIV